MQELWSHDALPPHPWLITSVSLITRTLSLLFLIFYLLVLTQTHFQQVTAIFATCGAFYVKRNVYFWPIYWLYKILKWKIMKSYMFVEKNCPQAKKVLQERQKYIITLVTNLWQFYAVFLNFTNVHLVFTNEAKTSNKLIFTTMLFEFKRT